MKRIMLTVAYDGTNYCGWQIQNNGETVEGVVNRELSRLLGEDIKVIGASRTDSGVHALGNVAVFDTETPIPPEKIAYALNRSMPEDITIQSSCEVAADFHPRYAVCRKTYEYKILNSEFSNPCERLYSYHIHKPLDVALMKEAAGYIIGEHDFACFCSAGAQVQTTVRTIYNISVDVEIRTQSDIDVNAARNNKLITIRICGNGFLYNMVRIIAGTLIQAGMGAFPPKYVKDIIESEDRSNAGPTAPACGLTLKKVEYIL